MKLFATYLVIDPGPEATEDFHYIALRKLVEKTIEAPLQLGVQGILCAMRIWHLGSTCGQSVNSWMLATSAILSFKAVLDSIHFLRRFRKLQTKGSIKRLIRRMTRLGTSLAPSALLFGFSFHLAHPST